jgi:ABC-type branched-subunit amino acid transport system substrate-binding protein
MEKAGTTTDASAIAEALTGMTWDGPMGPCTMDNRRELNCGAPMFVVDKHKVSVYDYESVYAAAPRGQYSCSRNACG